MTGRGLSLMSISLVHALNMDLISSSPIPELIALIRIARRGEVLRAEGLALMNSTRAERAASLPERGTESSRSYTMVSERLAGDLRDAWRNFGEEAGTWIGK